MEKIKSKANTITPGFTKKSRSTFAYWFAHWCAFQMVALNLGAWKPKYLLHDIEKPWLKLFMSYDKVKTWHRTHSKHHLSYKGNNGKPLYVNYDVLDKLDYQAMLIDWECSRYTKAEAPKTALQELIDLSNREGDFAPDKVAMSEKTHKKLLENLKCHALFLNLEELHDFAKSNA